MMPKVYVLVIEDRHIDTDVKVFASADDAISAAKQWIADNDPEPDDVQERKIAGGIYVYSAEYSCEGDSVSVAEREVQ